jgi:hypothetical protein
MINIMFLGSYGGLIYHACSIYTYIDTDTVAMQTICAYFKVLAF